MYKREKLEGKKGENKENWKVVRGKRSQIYITYITTTKYSSG